MTIPSKLDICFFDYVYPYSCGERRWAIIDVLVNVFQNITGAPPGYKCIPTTDVYSKTTDPHDPIISSCVAFAGIESSSFSQLSNQDFVITGPVYNFSRDFVLPYDNSTALDNIYDGWGFVYAFDWTVWCVVLTVVLSAFFIQLFMKHAAVDTSPGLTNETTGEIAARSIMATAGYSRLYQGNDIHVFTRHLLSSSMAIFSFIFIALYSSNLINFFFVPPDTQSRFPPVFSVGVHPALKNVISLETFHLFSGNRQSLRVITMVQNAVYDSGSIPVVTRTIGESLRNITTSLLSLGGYNTIYEVFLRRDYIDTIIANTSLTVQGINGHILKDIRELKSKMVIDLDAVLDHESRDTRRLTVIGVLDVYGIFVILFIGYTLSILYRIRFTKKRGLDRMVFYKKHETIGDGVEVSPAFNTPVGRGADRDGVDIAVSDIADSPGFVDIELQKTEQV